MFDVGLFPIDRNVCKTTNASDLKPVKIVLHFFQAVANAAYTLTSTSDLQTKLNTANSDKKLVCEKVCLRMQMVPKSLKNASRASQFLTATNFNLFPQVNSIIAIGAPGAIPSTAGSVAQSTPNSVTQYILPSGDTYSIKAVTDAGVTPTSTAAANGLALYTAEKGTTHGQDTTALSVTTFNTFRKQVADALNTLDAKIRQVTNLAQLTC